MGRKATLKTSADKLFFILLYCKCYSRFDLMSVLFGFDRSCTHNWVQVIERDLGYQDLHNEFVNVQLPHKKPKGQDLTESQKQENREFSHQQVKCEHAHAGMKRYNSVTATYRNPVPDFDDRLMLIAAGLWNFYLDTA